MKGLTHATETAVQYAANVVADQHGRLFGKVGEEVPDQCNAVLLLLTWSVDVGEEEDYVVTADKSHESRIVELCA